MRSETNSTIRSKIYVFSKYVNDYLSKQPSTNKSRKCKYIHCIKLLPIYKIGDFCCNNHYSSHYKREKRLSNGKHLVWRGVKRPKAQYVPTATHNHINNIYLYSGGVSLVLNGLVFILF